MFGKMQLKINQNRVGRGNRAAKFEIVRVYIENFEAKIDKVIRRFSLIL